MRSVSEMVAEPDLSCLPLKRRRRVNAIASPGGPAVVSQPRLATRSQNGAGSAAVAGSGGSGEPYMQWHITIRSLPLPSTRTFSFDLADDDPTGIVSLGRSRIQSNLVVDSKYAQTSRLHCTFRVAGKGPKSAVFVDDASSLNGLYVNERRVRSARLRTGDTLILGTVDSVGVGERLDRRKLTPSKTSIFEVLCVRSIQRPAFRTIAPVLSGGKRTRVAATITDSGPLGLDLVPQGDSMVVASVRSGAVKRLPFPRIAPGWVLESVSSMAVAPPTLRSRQAQQDVQVRYSTHNNWTQRLEEMQRPLHLVLSRLAFDVLGRLPLELVSVILDQLRITDLCKLAQCSRRCRMFVDRDRIWKPRCQELWRGKLSVSKPPHNPGLGGGDAPALSLGAAESAEPAARQSALQLGSAPNSRRRRVSTAADLGVDLRLTRSKTIARRRCEKAPRDQITTRPASAPAASKAMGTPTARAAIQCWCKHAYRHSLMDSRRVEFKDAEELCGLPFFFRFKSAAGHFWTDQDPSWNGAPAVVRTFNTDRTIHAPGDDLLNTHPAMSAFMCVVLPHPLQHICYRFCVQTLTAVCVAAGVGSTIREENEIRWRFVYARVGTGNASHHRGGTPRSALSSRPALCRCALSSAFSLCTLRRAAATDKGQQLASVHDYTVRGRLGLAARE